MTQVPLILASSSQSRLKLLKSILIIPDKVYFVDIDESQNKSELPYDFAVRLAENKLNKACQNFTEGYIIAADTVTACGRKILSKARSDEDVRQSLGLLSGRRHQVYTAVAVAKIQDYKLVKKAKRLVKTQIKFKRLTKSEIDLYVDSKQGINIGGGCAIDSLGEMFITYIGGSYSNVIGLPLYETKAILMGLGYVQKDQKL